jgi:predicted Zn-dependent protease
MSRSPLRGALVLAGALALLPLGSSCAVNPATGRTQLAFMGEQEEISLGRQNHQQILRTMGAYNDPALQNYVQTLGRGLARSSERPNLPWTFTVLDDTAVNAFALPGGFIYVTRGILALMNTEGELAGVLGHEIGHVTARHSVEQISRQQVANFGLLLGSVVAPELQQMGGALQQSVGLLLLKYSRDAERQADDLGVRYMSRNGYAPGELAEILNSLGRTERAQGGGSTPDFLSTHPNPGERVQRIRASLRGAGAPPAGKPSDRSAFVSRLQGLPYGPNPREGYFDGDFFYQPELGIEMELPRGWKRQNGKEALQAVSPDGTASLVVSVAQAQSARAAAQQFFSKPGFQVGNDRDVSLGGFQALDVPFAVPQQQGSRIVGTALFVEDGRTVFQLLGFGVEYRYDQNRRLIEGSLGSFSRLRERCRLDAQPARIEVVRGGRGMTLEDLARGSDVDVTTLAILNDVQPGTPLQPGVAYKKITGGGTRCGRSR